MSNQYRYYSDKRVLDESDRSASSHKRARGRSSNNNTNSNTSATQRNSYVLVGTELPALDEKDTGQFVPEWRQEVRDEKGRRRFHGAFTGGYSAGYFNTVGSKEGWAPSSFVSSRKQRAQQSDQRAEDFMDEEDIALQAEDRRLVAKDTFAGQGAIERVQSTRKAIEDATANSGALGDLTARIMEDLLVVPSKETIGTLLLRRMGWQEGQGAGPRQSMQLTVVDDEEDEEEGPSYATSMTTTASTMSRMTVAPVDISMVEFTDKKDLNGLGFTLTTLSGEAAQSLERLTDIYSSNNTKKPSQSMTGGYSLSIKDDDDDNDAFIYDAPQRSQFNMTLVDDEDEGEDDRYSYTIKSKTKPSQPVSQSNTKSKTMSTKLHTRLGHDGRPSLPGYHLADQSNIIEKWFAPPTVPDTFEAFHLFNEPGPDGQPPNRHKPKMTAELRGQLLGETPLEGPTPSVFDYLAPADRERLQKRQVNDQAITIGAQTISDSDIPALDPKEAHAALEGFMPFGDQPNKQTRYRRFLEVKAGRATEYLPTPKTQEDQSERAAMLREFSEFIQAARIFKPVAAPMAARFTSAQVATDVLPPVKTGLVTAADRALLSSTSTAAQPNPPPLLTKKNAAEEAAAMGMFGALTRTTQPFIPERLLLKRFNLPAPRSQP